MRNFSRFLCFLPLCMIILAMSGCGSDGNEDTDTASSVYFEIIQTAISGKYHGSDSDPVFKDVNDSRFGVTADYAELVLLHQFKGDPAQVQTGFTDIIIYAYSVYYERSQHDRDLGGSKVPTAMEKIPVSYTVPYEIEDDDEKKLNIIVTTIQQKLEPPLSYLQDEVTGMEPKTGLRTIEVNAFITLFAKDGAGNEVQSKTGQLFMDYANYKNKD